MFMFMVYGLWFMVYELREEGPVINILKGDLRGREKRDKGNAIE